MFTDTWVGDPTNVETNRNIKIAVSYVRISYLKSVRTNTSVIKKPIFYTSYTASVSVAVTLTSSCQ